LVLEGELSSALERLEPKLLGAARLHCAYESA
jgi:hypothetical protein